MAALRVATEADIVEMTEHADVKMKKPHRRLFVAAWKELLAAAADSTAGGQAADPPAAAPTAAGSATPAGAGGASPVSPAAAAIAATPAAIPDKYIAAENQLYLGKAADSTHGLEVLLGISGPMLGKVMQDPIAAIKREFAHHGSAEDKSNLAGVLDGSFDGQTLEVLVVHQHARMAKLEVQHVLALRMYTTSSFSCINDPLRMRPPQRCDAGPVFSPSHIAQIAC
jgi:hypothetical protein